MGVPIHLLLRGQLIKQGPGDLTEMGCLEWKLMQQSTLATQHRHGTVR